MVTNVPGAKAYRLIQKSDDGDGDAADDDGHGDDDDDNDDDDDDDDDGGDADDDNGDDDVDDDRGRVHTGSYLTWCFVRIPSTDPRSRCTHGNGSESLPTS